MVVLLEPSLEKGVGVCLSKHRVSGHETSPLRRQDTSHSLPEVVRTFDPITCMVLTLTLRRIIRILPRGIRMGTVAGGAFLSIDVDVGVDTQPSVFRGIGRNKGPWSRWTTTLPWCERDCIGSWYGCKEYVTRVIRSRVFTPREHVSSHV